MIYYLTWPSFSENFRQNMAGVDVFLDGPEAKARDAVHVIFANEKVWSGEPAMNPDVTASESAGAYRVLSLESAGADQIDGVSP
jgi:hypothetical protein